MVTVGELRQRQPRLHVPKVLRHANGQECTVRTPVCSNRNVIAAHYNWLDGGKCVGGKVHDTSICFACEACHAWLDDGRVNVTARKLVFLPAHLQTLYVLVRDGVLK